MPANLHYIIQCRNCKAIVSQCRCVGEKSDKKGVRWVMTCNVCKGEPQGV